MSDIGWMEAEAYNLAERYENQLDQAYKQGVSDAWKNVQDLWDKGTLTITWSAEEMMVYAEKDEINREKVRKLASDIGINALYAIASDMRGE